MSSMGWYTKKDVIKDLTKATNIKHFDVTNAVIGERPPPKPRNYCDDNAPEIGNGKIMPASIYNAFEEPDVQGIYDMLRMVDKFNDASPESTSTDIPIETSKNNILTITKLNPETPEFSPASAKSSFPSDDISNKNYFRKPKNIENCNIEENNKHTDFFKNEKSQDEAIIPKEKSNTDVSEVNVKLMREKLKSKICDTSNSNCYKVKRERNLAIATLLKLYSSKTPTVSSVREPPIKLLTPDYFETNTASNTQRVEFANNAEEHENNKYSNMDADMKESVHKVTKWLESSSCVYDKNNDNLNFMQDDETEIKTNNTDLLNDFNQTSKKLNKSNDKRPCIYLGPVVYKKKLISNPMSPCLSSSFKTNSPTPNKYIPSEYATELSKQYMENAKKVQEEKDIWTQLQMELRAKDENMKKVLKESIALCSPKSEDLVGGKDSIEVNEQ